MITTTLKHTTVRIAALVAFIAAIALATLPRPAQAHQANTLFRITFDQLHCEEETDWDGGSIHDEAYVVFFIADLSGFPAPAMAVRTDVFTDLDTGDRRNRSEPRLWGLAGADTRIGNADNVLILAAVMEHDDSTAGDVRTAVQLAMPALLLGYQNAGLSRATIVDNLRRDMDALLDNAAFVSGPANPDDRIGRTMEFRFSHDDLTTAEAGNAVTRSVRYRDGGEDATYNVRIRLSAP
jgi:hypothetical protein